MLSLLLPLSLSASLSLGCLHGVPPSDLAQARIAVVPLAPKGCTTVARVPVRGASSCGLGGECHATGRLFGAHDSLEVPHRKGHCSVRYDPDAGSGVFPMVLPDQALRGEYTCLVDGGDWLRVELAAHASPSSPEVQAYYGKGLVGVGGERPSFVRDCKDKGGVDWEG